MVLKSDKGKGKARVAAVPELEWNVKSGFWEGIAGSADLSGRVGFARAINGRERWISDEGKLSSVTNHLEVSAFVLFGGAGKLVPDVHPVTVLSVDALATDFNFYLGDELLTREIEPTGVYTAARQAVGVGHVLVDFGESYLEVCSVSKITISGDSAGYTAAEIGLAVEGLFDGFHREVSVSAVSYLPEGNLRITCKVNVLCAVGYELH